MIFVYKWLIQIHTNDDKQLIELKLVNLIHAIALRTLLSYLKHSNKYLRCSPGCLPNPDKNESVLKAFAIYAIKNHKQTLSTPTESSILTGIQTSDIRWN